MPNRIFIAGATGYIGSRLIPDLAARGHDVTALVRFGSEHKLPKQCRAVLGNALEGHSYTAHLQGHDTFVQLVGVAHPSPAKARQFVEIDQQSAMEAIRAAANAGVHHFIYVSVAHPAPAMHAYIAARTKCEEALSAQCSTTPAMSATILRPWYVLGPGHRWPYALIPFYWLAQRIPATRAGALRLGLVTLTEMLRALVYAVEHPAQGVRVMDVQNIRMIAAANR